MDKLSSSKTLVGMKTILRFSSVETGSDESASLFSSALQIG